MIKGLENLLMESKTLPLVKLQRRRVVFLFLTAQQHGFKQHIILPYWEVFSSLAPVKAWWPHLLKDQAHLSQRQNCRRNHQPSPAYDST